MSKKQWVFANGYIMVSMYWLEGRTRELAEPMAAGSFGEAWKVYLHRLVMARMLDRPLGVNEVVHHKNNHKTDNRPENLELWVTGHPRGANHFECPDCGRHGDVLTFTKHEGETIPRLIELRTRCWGPRGELHCVECGSAERKHTGHGLCQGCYDRNRYEARK